MPDLLGIIPLDKCDVQRYDMCAAITMVAIVKGVNAGGIK